MPISPDIRGYYDEGRERDRLTARPSLERLRTQVLLERYLPAPPARVLDVGGAAGVYATWLAGRGYQVHLVDPVPLHVEQATEVTDAGLRLEAIVPVEGPSHWAPGIKDRLADPAQRELVLDVLATIERDPAIAGLPAHLLAIARPCR